MTRMSAGDYELDDDPSRVDADAAVAFLTTEAYWGRWRGPQDIKGQIAAAWRVVGVYDRAGAMIGFARAWGDGGNAYLSDVYVLPQHRGAGLGYAIVRMIIDDGPGVGWRWMLHTSDAHGLYRQFGFASPSDRYLERPRLVGKRRVQARRPPRRGRWSASSFASSRCSTSTCRGWPPRQSGAGNCTAGPRCRGTRPRSARSSRRRSRPGTTERLCRSPWSAPRMTP